jgi:hypothetical protein
MDLPSHMVFFNSNALLQNECAKNIHLIFKYLNKKTFQHAIFAELISKIDSENVNVNVCTVQF